MVDQLVQKKKILEKKKEQIIKLALLRKKNEEIDIIDHQTPEEVQVPENSKNKKILISYIFTNKRWN